MRSVRFQYTDIYTHIYIYRYMCVLKKVRSLNANVFLLSSAVKNSRRFFVQANSFRSSDKSCEEFLSRRE